VGEIVVSGPSVAQGYFADPAATAACFGVRLADGSGPYLRTGDLGFLSEKGLFVVGRIKDLIKIRGRSLYASDIEQAALSAHPAVQPAGVAAFSVEDGKHEQLVVLAEIERGARRAPSTEILGAIREAVGRASGVTPSGLALLLPSRLPRTSSGKLRRAECRKQWLAGALELVALERLPT
jgi:acyl-CoA synthetase (AMP-forming)/AMP-acid ligase II